MNRDTATATAPGASLRALALVCCITFAFGAMPAVAQRVDPAEVTFWESVRDSQDADEIAAYLKAYPNGQFAPVARIRINKLKAATKAAPPADERPTASVPPKQAAPETPPGKAARMSVTVKVGELAGSKRGMLGVRMAGLPADMAPVLNLPDAHGAFVTGVLPNSPAKQAGIVPTDFVVDFDGRKIANRNDLPVIVGATPPGSRANVGLWRIAGGASELGKQLERRAQGGDDGAAYALAWLYLSENGMLNDNALAVRWSRQAADKGHPGGLYLLGHLTANGLGAAKDEPEAINLFRKSADQGNANAMHALGVMYANARGTGKDPAEAVRWYEKAAEKDHADAMVTLALMYSNGDGVPKDEAISVVWFRKAAEKNHPIAIANLGWMYESGKGVFQNHAQALRWYHKAADLNHSGAMYRLGVMTEAGHGVAKDPAEAVSWFRKAVERNHVIAMVSLGLMYENGRGIKKDTDEALRLFKMAAEKGNVAGQFYSGLNYERRKDFAKSVEFYAQAARKGDVAAMHNLGVAYDKGRGIGQDREAAADWIIKAVKGGSDFSVKQMTDNASAYSSEFRRAFQRKLREAGVYDDRIDGRFGPGTQSAVRALAKQAAR